MKICRLLRAVGLALPIWVLAACDDSGNDVFGPPADAGVSSVARNAGGKGPKGTSAPRIAFAVIGANGMIHTMNPDDSGYAPVPNTEGGTDPAWSPNRRSIAYAVTSGAEPGLYVIGTNGRKKVRLFSGIAGAPAWSPDGARIAFHALVGSATQILVVDANGANLQQVTAVGYSRYPTWSPDGGRMAYFSSRDTGTGLWIMNSNGTSRTLLKSCYDCDSPAWSPVPGDERIAFSYHDTSVIPPAGIGIISTTGGPEVSLVYGHGHGTSDLQPSWSPDGTQLVFTSSMLGGSRDILRVDADGTDVQRVAETAAYEAAPAWAN